MIHIRVGTQVFDYLVGIWYETILRIFVAETEVKSKHKWLELMCIVFSKEFALYL